MEEEGDKDDKEEKIMVEGGKKEVNDQKRSRSLFFSLLRSLINAKVSILEIDHSYFHTNATDSFENVMKHETDSFIHSVVQSLNLKGYSGRIRLLCIL